MAKICKWAGDPSDSYCKNCDGIKMVIDDVEKSCVDCGGYEEGTEDIPTQEEDVNEQPTQDPVEQTETQQNKVLKEESTNSTPNPKKPVKSKNTTSDTVTKVSEVKETKEVKEDVDGITVTSIRYTSGATIKKGDNYFKFIAEEEWALTNNVNIDDAREKLWAKLNSEVDKQIEDLENM